MAINYGFESSSLSDAQNSGVRPTSPFTEPPKPKAQPPGPAAPPWQYQSQDQAPAPTSPFDRTTFRDSWMATGSDKAAQDALLAQHNLTLDPAGRTTLPTGEIMDLRIGAKAGGTQAAWTGVGETNNGQTTYYNQGGSQGQGGSETTGFSQSGPLGGGVPPGAMTELYNQLLARAKQGTNINRMDPNIRAQADPYAANVERASRNFVADEAERLGPNANLRGERRLGAERAGQASGLFESQLIGRELAAKRDEIAHALDSMRGILSLEQQLALQKELSYLNDATQRYGIDSNANIAQGQLGLGRDRLGLDWNYYDWATDPSNPSNLPR